MKKALVAIAVSTSLFALSACGNNSETVVESNAGNVTKEELYTEMKKSKANIEQTLKMLVTEKVLDKKYDVTDEEVTKEFDTIKENLGERYEEILKQNFKNKEDELKEAIKSSLLAEKAVIASLTDEELNETSVKISHILIKTEGKDPAAAEAKAKELKAKIDAGEDFATLAKEHSEDEGSKANGGDVGVIEKGKMVPEFEAAALKLKENEVSDLVKSSYGYHILKATERKEYSALSEEEQNKKKKEIAQKKLQTGTAAEAIQKELDASDIKVKDDDFKDLFKAPEKTEEKK